MLSIQHDAPVPNFEVDSHERTRVNALNSRIRLVWGLRLLAGALILGAVATVAAIALDVTPFVGVALTVAILVVGVPYTLVRYRRWGYEVQDDALVLERGVLTTVDTAVPYVRVQHVDTQRSPLERLVGLSRVVVYTAGSRGADVAVPGLEPERADELHARLRRLAVESEPEDGV